jgi:hypothetical protein
MTATRRSSLKKRLERLEAARQEQTKPARREAFLVVGGFDEPTHLELTGSEGGRWFFEERCGPGPQFSDFGHFDSYLVLTQAEANA